MPEIHLPTKAGQDAIKQVTNAILTAVDHVEATSGQILDSDNNKYKALLGDSKLEAYRHLIGVGGAIIHDDENYLYFAQSTKFLVVSKNDLRIEKEVPYDTTSYQPIITINKEHSFLVMEDGIIGLSGTYGHAKLFIFKFHFNDMSFSQSVHITEHTANSLYTYNPNTIAFFNGRIYVYDHPNKKLIHINPNDFSDRQTHIFASSPIFPISISAGQNKLHVLFTGGALNDGAVRPGNIAVLDANHQIIDTININSTFVYANNILKFDSLPGGYLITSHAGVLLLKNGSSVPITISGDTNTIYADGLILMPGGYTHSGLSYKHLTVYLLNSDFSLTQVIPKEYKLSSINFHDYKTTSIGTVYKSKITERFYMDLVIDGVSGFREVVKARNIIGYQEVI